MTTAIDTNILVALWNEGDTLNTLARSALDAALERGTLVKSSRAAYVSGLPRDSDSCSLLKKQCSNQEFLQPYSGPPSANSVLRSLDGVALFRNFANEDGTKRRLTL